MSLKKKLSLAVLTTTLGASIMAAGSFALFTSTASNTGNTFSAGTLAITFDQQDTDIAKAFYFKADNIQPLYSETKDVVVTADGTLPLNYKLGATLGGDLKDVLEVTVFDSNNQAIDLNQSRSLAAGASETLKVKVDWPDHNDADNAYKGKTGSLNLVASATQQ